MAKITASVYTSHVPAIGAAIDQGRTHEPYWQPVFQGCEFSKQWMKDNRPDVIILVSNDHATAFRLEMIPTFAIGCAAEFQPADEGWGPRPVPRVIGYPDLAAHLAQSVIQDDFDLAIVNKMDVDHGLTVPLSLRLAGSEGIELVMWSIARGAMADVEGGAAPIVRHRFDHVPASNTAVGHLILENT